MALGIPSHKVPHTIHIKDAVAKGDIVRLEKLLKNYNGPATLNNALRTASCNGYLEIVKLLVEHGASITTSKNMPIICAAANGHIDIVKYFLENGADCTDRFNRAIRDAATNGHLNIVKLLIENGADCTDFDNGAIISASRNGHTEVVKLLLESGADYTVDNHVSLDEAIVNGHVNTIKVLLENDKYCNIGQHVQAIKRATYKGHIETVKLLINKVPHSFLPILFACACESGNLELVMYIFEYADKTLDDFEYHICEAYPLVAASKIGHLDIVKFLLEQDYDYADKLDEAFAYAAASGCMEIMELLIEKGANCNAAVIINESPNAIEAATQNNHLEAVEFLINHGAAKTPKQKVKLIELAADKGFMDIVEFLLNRVKKVNLNMAIKYATQNGHLEIAKLLIRHTLIHTSKDFDAQIEMIANLTYDIIKKY